MSSPKRSPARNVFGEGWKEKYIDLNLSSKATDGASLAASESLLIATWESGGGGTVGVVGLEECGSRKPKVTLFRGHKAPVHDIQVCPFYSTLFATASEDGTVKLWDCPLPRDDATHRDSVATLVGHDKKVCFSAFNHVAEWIIASGGVDCTLRTWDLEVQKCVRTSAVATTPLCLKWNYEGSLMAMTTRDRNLHVLDPRQSHIVSSVCCHEGAKPARCEWLSGPRVGGSAFVVSCGFTKTAERELALWDSRKMSEEVFRTQIDSQSAAIVPLFDEGTGLLFLSGKGDGNVRFYEVVDGEVVKLSVFNSSEPARDMAYAPKRAVNVMKCEVMRGYKILNSQTIAPISFCVPRRNMSEFQEELFPPCASGEAAMSAEEWLNGQSAVPLLQDMAPVEGKSPFDRARRPVDVGNLAFGFGRQETVLHRASSVLAKKLSVIDINTEKMLLKIRQLQDEIEDRDRMLKVKDEHIEALKKEKAAMLTSRESSHHVATAVTSDSPSEDRGPAKRSQVEVDFTGTQRELLRVQDTAHATTAELRSLCEEAELTKSQLDAIRRLLRESGSPPADRSNVSTAETKRASEEAPPSSVEVSQLIDVLLRRLSKTEKRNRELKARNGLLESLYSEMRAAAGRESARISAIGSREKPVASQLAAEVSEWASHTDRHIHTQH